MTTRPFDPSVIFSVMPDIIPYIGVTLFVAITSIILGSLLGMILVEAKMSKAAVLRWLAHGYTYIMRCTPSIVLLFIVFYGLPKLAEVMFDVYLDDVNRAVFAIITFALLFGAIFPKYSEQPMKLCLRDSTKQLSASAFRQYRLF